MNEKSYIKGECVELSVCNYLKDKGYRFIQKNYFAGKHGEVDLIMIKDNVVIFIEIRYRQRHNLNNFNIISSYKLFKFRKSVAHWFRHNHNIISRLKLNLDEYDYRCDLIIASDIDNEENLIYEHIKHVI